eukprot:COSAG05_NODE_22297_length_266_cov_0.371257_1_plen_70_part_00
MPLCVDLGGRRIIKKHVGLVFGVGVCCWVGGGVVGGVVGGGWLVGGVGGVWCRIWFFFQAEDGIRDGIS